MPEPHSPEGYANVTEAEQHQMFYGTAKRGRRL